MKPGERILGVEGGGTKTAWVLVENVSGAHAPAWEFRILEHGKLPASNFRLTSPERLRAILAELPKQLDRAVQPLVRYVLGDLVQQGITQSDESVTGTLTVISTIALLSVAVSWVSFRSRRVKLLTAGEPLVLVQDGRPIERNLRRERITLTEVQEEARRSQIASLADLQWAILEDDGHISCIPRRD